MVAFTKVEHFIEAVVNEEVDVFGTTDTFKAAIHTDALTVAADDELADLTQITGTGYSAGGDDMQNDATRTGGTVTMTTVDIVWTAGAADWTSTARYVTAQDDTSTTDILMGGWDYGATFLVGNGETFTLDTGASTATWA
jgi:hypothetical protein